MTIPQKIEPEEPLADFPADALLARAREAAPRAVRAGQFAPTFRLPDIHGGNLALIDLIEQGPLVLSFYRGVWCDFCDAALETLGRLDETIRNLGATHAAIGPVPGRASERSRLQDLPMPLLVDRGLKVTASYGLAISLPDALHEQYARLGYVPNGVPDGGAWKISIPAMYLIDRGGRVVMATIDADYRNRIEPAHLLSALHGLQARRLSSGSGNG